MLPCRIHQENIYRLNSITLMAVRQMWQIFNSQNKKVLLRERKRHTARCVAIASPCYSGGGGRGSPDKKFFPLSEHVSSQIWCQKFFPLLVGGGVPRQKIFLPVWTCIKPNLESKIFPFTETGYPPLTWTWDPPQTWDQLPPPRPRPGPPYLDLDLGHPPWTWTWDTPRPGPGTPQPGPGTPPTWTWTWDPPKSEQTDISKYRYYLPSYYVRGR